jgi:hypothetical protein
MERLFASAFALILSLIPSGMVTPKGLTRLAQVFSKPQGMLI